MTFRFVIGENMTLLFHVAGAAHEPEPQPPPVPVYSGFTTVLAALQGSITDNWEEETNDGNPGIHDS